MTCSHYITARVYTMYFLSQINSWKRERHAGLFTEADRRKNNIYRQKKNKTNTAEGSLKHWAPEAGVVIMRGGQAVSVCGRDSAVFPRSSITIIDVKTPQGLGKLNCLQPLTHFPSNKRKEAYSIRHTTGIRWGLFLWLKALRFGWKWLM